MGALDPSFVAAAHSPRPTRSAHGMTRMPLQDKLPAGQKPKYTGVVSGLTYTVRTTGFFSLYRGLAPTLLGSMPKAGIRFGGNSELKKVTSNVAFSGGGGGSQRVRLVCVCGCVFCFLVCCWLCPALPPPPADLSICLS